MKKLSYEYVKSYVEKEGYKLLSTEYINCRTKLEFICPVGHKFEMFWPRFQQGERCRKCWILSKYLSIKDIKKQSLIIAPGYKLISTKYINSHSKLRFVCPEGHEFSMRWWNFQQKCKCPKCSYNLQKLTIDEIQKRIIVIAPNYKLISNNYINSKIKIKFKCPKDHVFWMAWSSFKRGQRCPECHYNSIIKNYTVEELNKLDKYKRYIVNISNRNYKKYKELINPNNLDRSNYKYHLDHIFTIMEGFRRSIPAKYIANPYNLQMLWWKKNIIKSDKNWQSEKKLYQGYAKFKIRG